MAKIRHLERAPIREAVLELRFPRSNAEYLPGLRQALLARDGFADVSEVRSGSATFQPSFDGPPEGHVEPEETIGFRGASGDGLWVAQLRLDGLTLSRLAPYSSWPELSQRGRCFAEELLRLTQPSRVDRVALRYINHFRLPHPGQLDDYFHGLPRFPRTVPQFVSSLLLRTTLHDPVRDFTAHVTHSMVDDMDAERMGFILDVDAFRTTDFGTDVDELWETIDDLRVFKNEIFFGLITERNAELYE